MIDTLQLVGNDGAACGVRFTGSGDRALIFVHGVGSTAAIWDAQLEAFASQYRCAAVELRGNGVPKPEPPPDLITRAGFAHDVLAVADALQMDRFTLVGCSLGGVVGFELWQRAPERIEAFVILGSFAKYPDGEAYAASIIAAVQAAGSMEAFAQARASRLGLEPHRQRETIEQMAVKAVPSYVAATQATWTGDYTAMLPTITVPTLVCCGDRDAIAPPALSEAIAQGIPGARLAFVEDAGHVANADAPDRFNGLTASFLTYDFTTDAG